MVGDAGRPGTVAHACHRLVLAAESVRDQLSQDIWHILSRLDRTLGRPPSPRAQLRPQLDNVLESLLAVAGVVHESMVRDQTWGFLDGGIRVERAQLTLALLRATLTSERPPVIDGQVTEAVLEASESIITHRRRTTSGRGSGLAAALGHVPAAARRRATRGRSPSRSPGSATPCGWPATPRLVDRCDALAATARRPRPRRAVRRRPGRASATRSTPSGGTLRGLSGELGARYFGRKPPSRVLLGQWGGVRR